MKHRNCYIFFPRLKKSIQFCSALCTTRHHACIATNGLSLNAWRNGNSRAGKWRCLGFLNSPITCSEKRGGNDSTRNSLITDEFLTLTCKNDFKYCDFQSDVTLRRIVWPQQRVSISSNCYNHTHISKSRKCKMLVLISSERRDIFAIVVLKT